MCFPPEAVPPTVPDALLVTASRPEPQDVVLASADGTRFRAACARAPESRGPAVLILPDVRGLFGFYRNLTGEFAAAGHHAIAIDYFGRTMGIEASRDDFEVMSHIQRTTVAQVQLDLRAARDHLAQAIGESSFVTLGFCFGGSQSYLATTDASLGLSGAVSFYGGLDESRLGVFPRPASEAVRMKGPLLALFGGADPSIPEDLRNEFDTALNAAGVEHEFVVYPGAPHSFFDRAHGDFATDCADAWERVLSFVRTL